MNGQRIEVMPGHTPQEPNLHKSALTKRPLALRRLDRRAEGRGARQRALRATRARVQARRVRDFMAQRRANDETLREAA